MGTLVFVLSVIAGLLLLVFLVVIHELGHAIVARRNGVIVEEFGIGFPPTAWSKKTNSKLLGDNVTISINWLPLGGFVKLQGEHDAASKKGDYGAASFWAKTKIILAGVIINWLTAVLIFTVLAWIGLPKILANQYTVLSDTREVSKPLMVAAVGEASPADKVGLKSGDTIKKINGDAGLAVIDKASATTKANAGKAISVEYQRGGEAPKTVNVQLRTTEQAKDGGYLGVTFQQQQTTRYSTWSAPIVGAGVTAQLSWETLKGVGQVAGQFFGGLVGLVNPNEAEREQASKNIGTASQSVAGPFGLLGQIFPTFIKEGLAATLLITGVISLTLAVMNILPIPALDGGRWYTMAVFRLLRRPLTKEVEEKINTTGFLILLGLIALVTVSDVGKFF